MARCGETSADPGLESDGMVAVRRSMDGGRRGSRPANVSGGSSGTGRQGGRRNTEGGTRKSSEAAEVPGLGAVGPVDSAYWGTGIAGRSWWF